MKNPDASITTLPLEVWD